MHVRAIDNREANLTHIALYWDRVCEQWALLGVAESELAMKDCTSYWISKGTERDQIRVYRLDNDS